MRRLIAIFGILGTAFGLLADPFFHVHADGDHHEAHGAAKLHAHLPAKAHASESHRPEVEAGDDDDRDETEVTVFSSVRPDAGVSIAPALNKVALPVPRPSALSVLVPETKAHDPPEKRCTPPRSPPQ